MMYGVRPYTCNCVMNLDENNHTGTFVSECEEHKQMGYTADEVIAEHVAIQLEEIKNHVPIRRLFKKIKGWFFVTG